MGRFAPAEGRLLDVGAAAGFFVAEAIASGWKAEGIDVAEPMVRWGVAHLSIPLRVARLESVSAHRQYSAITMWDYIEHSVDPSADIERSASC